MGCSAPLEHPVDDLPVVPGVPLEPLGRKHLALRIYYNNLPVVPGVSPVHKLLARAGVYKLRRLVPHPVSLFPLTDRKKVSWKNIY